MNADLPKILETLIIGPDDRLVIVLPTGTSRPEFDHYRQIVDAQGFAGRVLLVANAEQLAVLRGEPS